MKLSGRVPLAVVLAIIFSAPGVALAADAGQVFVNGNELKWGDAPPSVPKGAKIAVLYGNPGASGPFVLRLMLPAGYKIPPHWHTQTENLTTISGALYLGDGDKMDQSHAHALKAGGFHYLPAKAHHFAFTKAATVVQVHGDGPFDINYINEKDDPQKVAKK